MVPFGFDTLRMIAGGTDLSARAAATSMTELRADVAAINDPCFLGYPSLQAFRRSPLVNRIVDVHIRRSSADEVFDHLYQEIVTLLLMPGAKISEIEVATRFGISRQPARDTFGRLRSLALLNIRPKRATEAARFSRPAIDAVRFVRMALEVEVARGCQGRWTDAWRMAFADNFALLRQTRHVNDKLRSLAHDFAFHRMICNAAERSFIVDVLHEKKGLVDRLCLLNLRVGSAIGTLADDHEIIIRRMDDGTPDASVAAMLTHRHRPDRTIQTVQSEQGDFFET